MNWILFEAAEIDREYRILCCDQRAEHIRKVLHTVPGQAIRVGIIDGPAGIAWVEAIEGEMVRLRWTADTDLPPRPRTDLLLALPRPKVMKRLWAPLASIGVGHIAVTNAAKVERNYFDTHWLQPDYYRPLLLEGLQQAGDTRLPVVSLHRQFRPLVEDRLAELFPGCRRLVADPSGGHRFRDLTFPDKARAVIAVGPEGGWTPFELNLLQTAGFVSVRAGDRILRTDTACLALLALLQDRIE